MTIADLPNLGPKSAAMLGRAGVASPDQLEWFGPVRAYVRCVLTGGASKVLLYALLGNELTLHWSNVPDDIKAQALIEADARLRAHAEGLLHIVSIPAWKSAGDPYSPPSLTEEGFIHCSTRATVLTPANERYPGQKSLGLLDIDPDRVEVPIVFEDTAGTGTEFPHIYGPLDRSAVIRVIPMPPESDGSFRLPAALS